MKNLIYLLTFILLTASVKAQQLPSTSLYNVNKFQINSAYAGFNNCTEGYLSHRSQWVGIDAAPKISFLSLHSGIAKNMGLGANIVFDKTDIISKFSGSLSYAYRIKLGSQHNLRLGLSVGMYQISVKPSNAIVDDITDDIVIGGNQSSIAFKNDFSLFYNYKNFQLGVSVPQVFETNANYSIVNGNGSFGLKRHIITYAGYNIKLTEKLSLQPSALYKTFNGSQNQLDINSQITYNNFVSIGAGYRTNSGLLARFGVNLKELVTLAYAYELPGNNTTSLASSTHEIMLGVKFCESKQEKIVDIVPNAVPELVVENIPEPVIEVPVIKETPIPDPVIKETPQPKEIDLSAFNASIKFPLDKTTLDKNFEKELNKIVSTLKENPNLNIQIIGHSCDLGNDKIKKDIALDRAKIVETYLIKKGISPNRLEIQGKSDTENLIPNNSEINRQKNRRVDFKVN